MKQAMNGSVTVGVCSDLHFAGLGEQARGRDYEFRGIANPLVRLLLRAFRRFIWLRNPLGNNPLLEVALEGLADADFLVANGDFSCDSAFVGVSDDAAFASARECLDKLRARFGDRFRAIPGDHELGKFSFAGNQGGMRRASYERMVDGLKVQPFWQHRIGLHVLIGVTSSLIALPAMQSEMLSAERPFWEALREEHLRDIRAAFEALRTEERVVLFCHDPTALPFLAREPVIHARLGQVQCTVIGHLHTALVFRMSRMLAGMPEVRWFGHSLRKMSRALREARNWRGFNVHLCPSLSGVELLKDGGFLTLTLHPQPSVLVRRHAIPR